MCLPETAADDYTDRESVVTGWGTTTSGGSTSETLREVTVNIISNQVLVYFCVVPSSSTTAMRQRLRLRPELDLRHDAVRQRAGRGEGRLPGL